MLGWAPGTGASGTGAHLYSLEVNGFDLVTTAPTVDRHRVRQESIRVTQPGPSDVGSMEFEVVDPDEAFAFEEWQHVEFFEWAATPPKLFGGYVQNVQTDRLTATGRIHKVTAMGYGTTLDRRMVPSIGSFLTGTTAAQMLQDIAGRFATHLTAFASVDLEEIDGIYELPGLDWNIQTSTPIMTDTSTRTVMETVLAMTRSAFLLDPGDDPTGFKFWVDALDHLQASPLTVDHYTGTVGTDTPSLNPATVQVQLVSWERDGSDKTTSSYVRGGNANGTGFVRGPKAGHAGDLEEVINEPLSTTATLKDQFGGALIEADSGARFRSTLNVISSTPLDYRPGQQVSPNLPPIDVPVASYFITANTITWASATVRTYHVTVGGTAGRPSAAHLMGRLQRRRT